MSYPNHEDAKRLLENPAFVDAFANVREGIVAGLESCPLDNDVYRNQLVISLQVLNQVKEDIEFQINPTPDDE